jgi:hypothetical protein
MKYSEKKRNTCTANFIDYIGFLIGLKCETITKIANNIQQFPSEIIIIIKNIWEFLGVTA